MHKGPPHNKSFHKTRNSLLFKFIVRSRADEFYLWAYEIAVYGLLQ